MTEELKNRRNNGNEFERHAQTALTALVVLLLAGLVTKIFKIDNTQTEQLIELRALQFQVQAVADAQSGGSGYIEREISRVDFALNTIWPRLRVHDENLTLLKREIEALCNCDIQLNDPEKF